MHVFCKDDTYLCRAIATFLPDEIRPSLSRKQLSNFAPRHARYMCVHANAIFPRSFSFPLLQLSFYRRKRSFDARIILLLLLLLHLLLSIRGRRNFLKIILENRRNGIIKFKRQFEYIYENS